MNIDVGSLLTIAIAIVAIYFFVKLIISPVIKLIGGILIFLIAIYILKQFFNVNFNILLGPLSKYFDLNSAINSLNWIISPIASYINMGVNFFKMLLNNVPKQ